MLAQNYLSNDFVDILMEHAKKMKFENVKNIMIGQNTMNLRKLKEKAEELKKWNINLVL